MNHPPSDRSSTTEKPLLVVISGPSGVGKDAVLNRLKDKGYPLHFVVTATTRLKRNNEVDGRDYHFIDANKFQNLLTSGEFVEASNVYGNWYGVPKKEIESALKKGMDVIVKVDIQGALKIKSIFPRAILIFLSPPSFQELTERLKGRNSDSQKDIEIRIATANKELTAANQFKYILINHQDAIENTATKIYSIIQREKEPLMK